MMFFTKKIVDCRFKSPIKYVDLYINFFKVWLKLENSLVFIVDCRFILILLHFVNKFCRCRFLLNFAVECRPNAENIVDLHFSRTPSNPPPSRTPSPTAPPPPNLLPFHELQMIGPIYMQILFKSLSFEEFAQHFRNETEMLSKLFKIQWKYPTNHNIGLRLSNKTWLILGWKLTQTV